MKIALISPPWIPLPPIGYGGIEAVVYHLGEGLKKKGHDVIMYATGDSHVSTNLRYFYEQSLGKDMLLEKAHVYYFMNQVHFALKDMPQDVDIIHNHCEYAGMHLLNHYPRPFLHTLHGAFYPNINEERYAADKATEAFRETLQFYKNDPFVSISNAQRQTMLDLNYIRTVYNGTPIDLLPFQEHADDYMCWLGRFSPLKGLPIAITVSKQMKRKLIISASIHEKRLAEFRDEILPQIANTLITVNPEIQNQADKAKLVGNAKLFLFPIQWEEPFGIVMTEAMSCGTPVVAYARGSVPEVIVDGVTGFLINPSDTDIRGNYIIKKTGIEGMCEAAERIYSMSEDQYIKLRKACRKHVEDNFTVEKMVEGYEEAYQKVLEK